MSLRLTKPQARRIAVAAQGIGRPRPRSVTMRDVSGVIDRLGQFQIDSVNVLARAHLLPLFSRLGPYDQQLLSAAAEAPPRRLYEYWGHAASFIDTSLAPAFAIRRAQHARQPAVLQERLTADPDYLHRLDAALAGGPLTARQLPGAESGTGSWWGWSEAKQVAEHLLASGHWACAGRNGAFERRYDLAERVLPEPFQGDLPPAEAHVLLARRAAAALGVFSLRCLADYFRLGMSQTRQVAAQLERDGEFIPVEVEGWPQAQWVWHEAAQPRRIAAATIVSPFDSLAFERQRLSGLFDFEYRIEIYTPAAKREYGYYVYPFIYGDAFVARTDLKADRKTGRLLVQASWLERSAESRREQVASALATNLQSLAVWLDLRDIVVSPVGDFAADLGKAC